MRIFLWLAVPVLAAMSSGCASFSTMMLNRSEDNTCWDREVFLRGVPVTLKVPTHVRIDVIERHFLVTDVSAAAADSRGIVRNPVIRSKPPVPIRKVTYTPIETEQIFLVDLKRPAAGVLDATIDLDPEAQYFKQIQSSVEDETIAAIGDLIAAVAPGGLFGVPTTEGLGESFPEVKEIESVIASQVFEVNAPDFELQVMGFLDRFLNCGFGGGTISSGTAAPWALPAFPEHPRSQQERIGPPGSPAMPDLEEVPPAAIDPAPVLPEHGFGMPLRAPPPTQQPAWSRP